MKPTLQNSFIDIYVNGKRVTCQKRSLFSKVINGLIEKGFWYSYDITVHPPHSLYRECPLQKKLRQEEFDNLAMKGIIHLFSKEEKLDFVPNNREDHEN